MPHDRSTLEAEVKTWMGLIGGKESIAVKVIGRLRAHRKDRRYPAPLGLGVVGAHTVSQSTRSQTPQRMMSAFLRICCYRKWRIPSNVSRTHPISKKILRISSRTFKSGCKAPPLVGIPSASKLYFLKVEDFHAPLVADPQRNLGTTCVTRVLTM